MSIKALVAAVAELGETVETWAEADLSQPFTWKWHDEEGVRFALIGSYQELHEAALDITARRLAAHNAPTATHSALALYNNCYRDLQALMIGISDELYTQEPKSGEWSLRAIYSHITGVERHFYTLIHYALRRAESQNALPLELPDGEANRVTVAWDEFEPVMSHGTRAEMAALAAASRGRILETCLPLTDAQLQLPTLWWEGAELSIRHRILRFSAHNRQHTIQTEKTLGWLGAGVSEAKQLVRQLYSALAAVENALMGASDADVDNAALAALAEAIQGRTAEIVTGLAQAHAFRLAIEANDSAAIEASMATHTRLSEIVTADGVSSVLFALYHGNRALAERLAAQKPYMSLHEAAAVGDEKRVQAYLDDEGSDEWVKSYSTDGYTPLQLAAFFGNEGSVRLLVEGKSDLNAISKNNQATTPLHAATAGNHTAIVQYLVAQGADCHHLQNGGVSVLHSAAQNGNVELVTLFLAQGVNPATTTDDGRTARDFAEKQGYSEIVALLPSLS